MLRKNNLSHKSVKCARSKKKANKDKPLHGPSESGQHDMVTTVHSANKNVKPNFIINQQNDNNKLDSDKKWDNYMESTIPFYQGNITVEEVEQLLKNNGDFILRKAEVDGKVEFIFTVRKGYELMDLILIRTPKGCYVTKEFLFNRPEDVMRFYMDKDSPINKGVPLFLKGIERPNYYLNSENIEIKQKIGEGAFGEVNEAVMKRSDGSFVKVAAKNLKGFSSKQDRDDFMEEFKFMNQFEHDNIVKIYGITIHSTRLVMILEMCYGGSLNSYLKKNPLPYKHLIKYCIDAARGMCYLSTRNVIHRDIAARNCLLGGNDEVKISDFGLSVISKNPVKAGKNQKIAIRWCAPETILTGFFQMKTDVWSYGILMWEIFSHCQFDPFPGKTNAEVKAIVLSTDKPLDLPKDVPSNVLKCYKYCLFKEASFRPNFIEILKFLSPREQPPIPERMKNSMMLKTSKLDSNNQCVSSKRKQTGF